MSLLLLPFVTGLVSTQTSAVRGLLPMLVSRLHLPFSLPPLPFLHPLSFYQTSLSSSGFSPTSILSSSFLLLSSPPSSSASYSTPPPLPSSLPLARPPLPSYPLNAAFFHSSSPLTDTPPSLKYNNPYDPSPPEFPFLLL